MSHKIIATLAVGALAVVGVSIGTVASHSPTPNLTANASATAPVTAQTQIQTDINCIQGARVELNSASLGNHSSLAKVSGTLSGCQSSDQSWLTANPATTTTTVPPTTTQPPATTTTTVAPTTTTTVPPVTTGSITAGNSKTNCIYPNFNTLGYNESEITAAINAVTATTGVTYNCTMAFNNSMATWAEWDSPWPENDGFGAWVKASPGRQFILGMSLVPSAAPGSNGSDPLEWETACAAGNYNSYATTLAQDLIGTGLGNSVIRLGLEANGTWESDDVGNTTAEETAWAQCFDQEVTTMRSVAGGSFLFVWNPNSCYQDLPFANFYPGNAYVDIIGLDQYDSFCTSGAPTVASAATFTSLEAEPDGLNAIATFAKTNNKPLALPEWGLSNFGDDPYYITGMGNFVASNDVAFETYFDSNTDGIPPLSSSSPKSLAAYITAFG